MDRRNFPGLPLKPFVLPPLQPRYSAEPPEWTQSAPASDELAGFWQTLRYRKSTIVAVVLAFFAAAVIYTRWQTPMYQASVDLELQEPEGEFSALRTDSSNGFTNATSEAAIQTHVALLRSDPVVRGVVRKLSLAQPEADRPSKMDFLWQRIFGQKYALDTPEDRAVRESLGNLSVQHQARVIEVRYSSPDPVQAASFVNTLIREYRRQGQDSQQKDMQELGQWLDNQNQALKQSIEKTESQLAGYANGKGLVYTEEHGSSVVAQRLRLTSEDLSQAQADRMVKQSRSEQAAAASADSLPQSLENGSVRDYQVKLTELRTQLEQLKSVLSPKSYKVQSVESQIAVVKSALDNELANTKKRLENEYKAALNREQMVQSRYNRQLQQAAGETAESVHYGSLKRDLETAQTLRAQIQQKEQQVGMAAVAPNSHLRTIGQATPPSRPYKPNYWLNLSLAIFGGLLIGGMLALLQEHRHRAFRAPGEAFTRLQLPELGAILSAGGNALPLRRALKAGAFDNRLELAAWQKQVSPLVESIHDAVTSLLTRCEAGPTVVLITSPCAGDGKTTIVTNLAIALAQCNRRVLLIDGDVRRPRIHKIFNLPARPGLSDLLRKGAAAGSGAPATITNPLSIPNLHVMTCGSPIPPNVPLFSDSQLPRLLMRLRTEYDAVLIDAPPVLQGPNARLLGRLCDAVILVLRAGRTTHKEATASLTRLFNDNIQVAGTILNDWDPRGDDSPYSYASRSAYATAAKWEDD